MNKSDDISKGTTTYHKIGKDTAEKRTSRGSNTEPSIPVSKTILS